MAEGHHSLGQNVDIRGLNALRRILQPPDELLVAPWKDAMTELAELGERSGKAYGPRGTTGKLTENIKGRVQKGEFPRWAAIRSRARSKRSKKYPRGFEYPRLLNYSPKHRTKGWFDRSVIEVVLARANEALASAADAIAKKWGSG